MYNCPPPNPVGRLSGAVKHAAFNCGLHLINPGHGCPATETCPLYFSIYLSMKSLFGLETWPKYCSMRNHTVVDRRCVLPSWSSTDTLVQNSIQDIPSILLQYHISKASIFLFSNSHTVHVSAAYTKIGNMSDFSLILVTISQFPYCSLDYGHALFHLRGSGIRGSALRRNSQSVSLRASYRPTNLLITKSYYMVYVQCLSNAHGMTQTDS